MFGIVVWILQLGSPGACLESRSVVARPAECDSLKIRHFMERVAGVVPAPGCYPGSWSQGPSGSTPPRSAILESVALW